MEERQDLISRQALCEYALNQRDKSVTPNDIMRFPSAQPKVIHCKDCEWWTKQDKSLQGRCELMQMHPTGEWFCGNAQKKEGEK